MSQYRGMLLTAVSGLALIAGSAVAQEAPVAQSAAASMDDLQEVVVTARRKAENIQDTPVAVSAISAAQLAPGSIDNASDIQFHVPSLQVNPSQYHLNAEPTFTLRGLSTTNPGGTVADAAVSTYFAEAPLVSNLQIGHELYDLQDVQVLRGPQGTLFGKNSTGGAVLFDPARPTEKFEGKLVENAGNYNLSETTGVVNVPISDVLQVRLAGQIGRRDGYDQNLLGPDGNNEHFDSGRFSVEFKPTDWLENYTMLDGYSAREHGVQKITTGLGAPAAGAYGPGGPFADPTLGAFSTIQAQFARQKALGPHHFAAAGPTLLYDDAYTLNNVTQIRFSDDLSLKNIVSYQHAHTMFDLSNTGLIYNLLPDHVVDTTSQVSEEFQVLGKALGGKLDWIAGTFYDHQDDSNNNPNLIYTNYNPATKRFVAAAQVHTSISVTSNDSNAVFAHGVYDLDGLIKGLKFNAGYRYTWDTKAQTESFYNTLPLQPKMCAFTGLTVANCVLDFSKATSAASWIVGVDYHLNDKVMFYVASRRGYKSGGFNSTTGIPGTFGYAPETVTDVELGTKSDLKFGDVPLRTNVALFHGQYNNPTIPFLPVYQGSLYQVIQNVSGAVIQGVELELSTIPMKGVELSGSYSFTDSAYDSGSHITTVYGPGGTAARVQDLSGKPLTQASKHTLQLSALYSPPIASTIGDLSFGVDYAWRSAQLLPGQGGGNAKVPAFGVMNLHATLDNVAGRPVDLGLWAKNVLNRTYITSQQLFAAVGLYDDVTYGDPQTFGATLTYHW